MVCDKCGYTRLRTRVNPEDSNERLVYCPRCNGTGNFKSMSPDEYQTAAMRTCDMLGENAPIRKLLMSIIGCSEALDHVMKTRRPELETLNGVLGLNGEAGECIDIVKKHIFQGHEMDRKHLAEELGDVAWYLAVTAHGAGYTLSEIMEMNIEKLKDRYPDGFDPERSIHRAEYEEANHD